MAFSPEQHPIVLQIGGNNLENIAKATELSNAYGYDEINFKFVLFGLPFLFSFLFVFLTEMRLCLFLLASCGCPSPRVAGHGCFGVRLMLDPKVW